MRTALLPVGLAMLAFVVSGCGSSTPKPNPTRVSNVIIYARTGVHFAAEVRIRDKRACFFTNYRIIAPHVKPLEQTTRSCGPSDQPALPMLIEVAKPRTIFILDRPTGGCTSVSIATGRGRPIAAHPACSATKPTLRLTPLPPDGTLAIHGISGVTRLSLRKYRCPLICTRVIAAPS
ncbi:MAG: hypothetical protein M3071_14495 [Actinomycetota bacterium]|nr:hypothetical protein [Actinomycetota bacterium]